MNLKSYVRYVNDFPVKGILFRDLIPIWENSETLQYSTKELKKMIEPLHPTHLVCLEARGFLVGAPLAYEMGLGLSIIRKKGRIPGEVYTSEYKNEYIAEGQVEIHKQSLKKGDRIVFIDDILATGKSGLSCINLVEQFDGAIIAGFVFLLEIQELKGKDLLAPYAPVKSLILD